MSFTGFTGFTGLVVPTSFALWFNPDHSNLLPCSAILGILLQFVADLMAHTLVILAEMPIDIIPGSLGLHFFFDYSAVRN